jgi:hypothetical protein
MTIKRVLVGLAFPALLPFLGVFLRSAQHSGMEETTELGTNIEKRVQRKGDFPVLSGAEMNSGALLPTFPTAYDFVIIVPDRLLDAIVPLVEWKTKKGLKTSVIRLSSIGESPGYDEISSYIRRLYEVSTTPIQYILLAGDAEEIPPHYRLRDYGGLEPEDDEWVVSDMFYGIMGDGPFPEIHVGRFPASTEEEMVAMVQKTLSYEKEPYLEDGDWFSRALLFGGNPEFDGYVSPNATCEYALDPPESSDYDVLDSLGWEVECRDPDSSRRISELINRGMSLVCSYGHGSPRHVEGFSREAVSMLENGSMLPLWISGCCNSARFDNKTHPHETIFGRSLAEALLRPQDKGVIGFIGCSRTGGPGYHYRFFDGCFAELSRTGRMGAVLDAGKRESYTSSEAGYQDLNNNETTRQYIIEHMNLLGDPELPIYTRRPHRFHVSVNGSPAPFRSDNRIAVARATVCLRRSGNDMLVGETDSNGEITFTPPASWNRFDVTVTKKNCVPSTASHRRGGLEARAEAWWLKTITRPVKVKVEDTDAEFHHRVDTRRWKKEVRVDPEIEVRKEFLEKDNVMEKASDYRSSG